MLRGLELRLEPAHMTPGARIKAVPAQEMRWHIPMTKAVLTIPATLTYKYPWICWPQSAIWQALSFFLFTPLSPFGLQSHLSGIVTLEWLSWRRSAHSRAASGGQETKREARQHPQGWYAHGGHANVLALHGGRADHPTPAEPAQHGKVFLSHHASSEWHSQNQPPANTGNTGRSWLGCFWKAKQLKEMFSLIERGFLGPRGQFWRPESVQCTGSRLCFIVLTPCCFRALAEWRGSVDRDFKGTFRI